MGGPSTRRGASARSGLREDLLVRLEEQGVGGALQPPPLLRCLPLEQLEDPLLVAVGRLHVAVGEPVGVGRDVGGHQEELRLELQRHQVVVLHGPASRLRQHRPEALGHVVCPMVTMAARPPTIRACRRLRATRRAEGTGTSPPTSAGSGTCGPRRACATARSIRCGGTRRPGARPRRPGRRSRDAARTSPRSSSRLTSGRTSEP